MNFMAKTEFGIVLEHFCKIEVGLRQLCPMRREKRNLDFEIFCPKEKKGERELDLE